jgi:signal recognition particle receptor subunit beta
MVMINRATKEITLKIVYYGPGLCGKTTNLEHIYAKANPEKRGKLLTVATETDRTLFFDFLPMELGTILGMKLRVQLYTVPGQVFYDATRRIVLRGSDGIVFVADSQKLMADANWESLENMKKNLVLNSMDPNELPLVFQYNKQDLPNLSTEEELEETLNWRGVPHFTAVATIGTGVNETVRKVIELVIRRLHEQEANLRHPQRAAEVPPSPIPPPVQEAFSPPADEPIPMPPETPAILPPTPQPAPVPPEAPAVRSQESWVPEPVPPLEHPVSVEDTDEELAGVEVEQEFDMGEPAPPILQAMSGPESEFAPGPPSEIEMEGVAVAPDEVTAIERGRDFPATAPPTPAPGDFPLLEMPPQVEPLPEVEEATDDRPMVVIEAPVEFEPLTLEVAPEPLPESVFEVEEAEALPEAAVQTKEAAPEEMPELALEVEVSGGLEEIPISPEEPTSEPENPQEAAADLSQEVPAAETLAGDMATINLALDGLLFRLKGFVSEVEDLKARLTEFEGRFKD